MVSTVFVSPQNGDDVQENTDFDISVQTSGLSAGTFTNAQTTYYSAPQDLDGGGQIIGHTHVTVQDTGNSLNPTNALDATQFAFFKGINDAGNGQGLLTATVTGGLPAGNYRICSMSSAANHQPVLMPVAQRGAQDDCIRVTVGAGGGNNNANNGQNQNNGGNNANNGQNQNNGQQGDAAQGDAANGGQQDANQGDQANQGDAAQGDAANGSALGLLLFPWARRSRGVKKLSLQDVGANWEVFKKDIGLVQGA
ncbi:hypothetical protein AUP68_05764 [Ilyonectria robusta]